MSDLAHPAAAFGLGIAIGTSPGPVQLLLFSEASRGGVGRGLRAMAGANGTFGTMLLLLALGLSSLEPGRGFLRVVQVIGGSFLVFLAVDALRESRRPEATQGERAGLHPTVRGVVAVVVNPASTCSSRRPERPCSPMRPMTAAARSPFSRRSRCLRVSR